MLVKGRRHEADPDLASFAVIRCAGDMKRRIGVPYGCSSLFDEGRAGARQG